MERKRLRRYRRTAGVVLAYFAPGIFTDVRRDDGDERIARIEIADFDIRSCLVAPLFEQTPVGYSCPV